MNKPALIVSAVALALGAAVLLYKQPAAAAVDVPAEDIDPVRVDEGRIQSAHFALDTMNAHACAAHGESYSKPVRERVTIELDNGMTYTTPDGAVITVGFCVAYPRVARMGSAAPFDEALYLKVEADTAARIDALRRPLKRVDYTAQIVLASRYTH